MRFTETRVAGAYIVDLEPRADERGFFARAFCAHEFDAHGLVSTFVQANISRNVSAGTIRGLHYQDERAPEAKLFRCIRGSVFSVTVDVREGSPSYGRWAGVELSDENRRAFFIPEGCAAGYQALVDGAEVLYLVSGFYTPDAECGLRPDDPAVAIDWPLPAVSLSQKDLAWPLLGRAL
jgi:dTDP-4-dehydrorhamnose 3,5-epimerase